jgi:hypothetical protein
MMRSVPAYYFIIGHGLFLQLSVVSGFYFYGFVPVTLFVFGVAGICTSLRNNCVRVRQKEILLTLVILLCILCPFAVSCFKGELRLYSLSLYLVYIAWPFMIGGATIRLMVKESARVWNVVGLYAFIAVLSLTLTIAKGALSPSLWTVSVYRMGVESNSQGYAFAISSLFFLIQCIVTSRVLRALVIVLGAFVVFASASRGVFAAYMFSSLLHIAFTLIQEGTRRFRYRMPRVTLRQIAVLTTVIVALAVTVGTGGVPRRLEELFRPMVQMSHVRWVQAINRYRESGPFLGTGREEFLRLAKEKIQLNPITGDFGYAGAQGIYSHNTFYDALAQMGVIWGSILLFVAVMPVYIFAFNMKKICNNKILLFLFLTHFASMMRGFISNTLLGVPHFWHIVGGITSYYSIAPVTRRKSCRSAD